MTRRQSFEIFTRGYLLILTLTVLTYLTYPLSWTGMIGLSPATNLGFGFVNLGLSLYSLTAGLSRGFFARWVTYVPEEPPRIVGLRTFRFRLRLGAPEGVALRLRSRGAKSFGVYRTNLESYGPGGRRAVYDHDGARELIEKVPASDDLHELVQVEGVTDPEVLAGVIEGEVPREWAVSFSKGSVA